MKYLLDTHILIWLDSDQEKLSSKVAQLCTDRSNRLLVSVATVWEMQIKILIGKLTLPDTLANTISGQVTNGIQLLPINLPHILELAHLPDHHKDPFDRLLIAQARTGQATLISNDPQIAKYPVNVVW
jgi:PIN domain nuclease of toxin-antitoxin system